MKKTKKRQVGLVLQKLFLRPEKLREAMELYPGKTREEVRELLWKELSKKLLLGAILAVFFLALAVKSAQGRTEPEGIERPSPGSTSAVEQILLETEAGWQRIALEIGAREYEETQIEELHLAAEAYLDEVVPGENESFNKVITALYFPAELPEHGGSIYWSTDAPWVVTSEGEVLNAELSGAVEVAITAEISYGSEQRYFTRQVMVYPAEYTGEEAALRAAQSELARLEEATRTAERFVLPETVLGYAVQQETTSEFGASAFLVLLAVAIPLLLYSGYFGSLDTRRKERKELAEGCYTEFITKLSLLLAAGVSVRQAFLRLGEEYETHHGPEHVLAAELKVTRQELENGRSETEVYEAFGQRIGVLAYRRMASLLTQNVVRGVQGMRSLLLQEAKEVMAQDRANIKRRGEQAGTKLLFPMMGLLFLVFAILLVPAFQSF